jgi:predicted transposase YbfD/YdcC
LPKKTLKEIIKTNNHAILQVKDNQPTLHKACQEICNSYNPTDKNLSRELGHGRFEKRYCYVFSNPEIITRYLSHAWSKYISCIVLIHRERNIMNTKSKKYELSVEDSYYIATNIYSAKEFNQFIRDHWGIENRSNYVRDKSMREDYSRIRINPDRMVRLRSFALNIMRINKVTNVKNTMFENALNTERVISYKFLL